MLDSCLDRANDLGQRLIRPRTPIMNDVDSIVDRSESLGLARTSMHESSPTANGNIWPWKGIYLLCWMAPSIKMANQIRKWIMG